MTNRFNFADSMIFKIEAPTIFGINNSLSNIVDNSFNKRLKSKNGILHSIEVNILNTFRIGNCCLINKNSPMKYKKCVEKLALYFKREMNYDFVQFLSAKATKDNYEAWLFYTTTEQVVGACNFLKQDYENRKDINWKLDWIWMHPYIRHSGFLSKVWSGFKTRYGLFDLEFPISKPMKQFILKNYSSEIENIYPGITKNL
jgi:hypothetical protein